MVIGNRAWTNKVMFMTCILSLEVVNELIKIMKTNIIPFLLEFCVNYSNFYLL